MTVSNFIPGKKSQWADGQEFWELPEAAAAQGAWPTLRSSLCQGQGGLIQMEVAGLCSGSQSGQV